jgi:hypothetical protein
LDNTNKDEEKDNKPKSQKPPNWRIEEDQALCTSWLNTLKDTIVGSNQTKSTFWDCIQQMYLGLMEETVEKNKSKKGFKAFPTRLKGALENCWYTIQQLVGKFCGFYAQVKRRLCSGANHDNIVSFSLHDFSYTWVNG